MANIFRREIIKVTIVYLIHIISICIVIMMYQKHDLMISLKDITADNIFYRLTFDILACVILPFCILIIYRNQLKQFRMQLKYKKLCLFLIAVLFCFFLLKGDFTIGGVYILFFYLISTGFYEEFFYRGYMYNTFRQIGTFAAILYSGFCFGIGHSILPIILGNVDSSGKIEYIISYGVWGILQGCIYIYLQSRSGSLFVPILIHAVSNYSYRDWGIAVRDFCIIGFIIKDIFNNRKKIIKFFKDGGIERKYLT